MQEEKNAQWEQLAREVLSGMKEWRSQHPQATFAEIEEAREDQVAKMRARMLSDVVQCREMGARGAEPLMGCNACGGELEERGKHVRHLTTQGNQQIKLERSYGYCPTSRVGFFPAFLRNWSYDPRSALLHACKRQWCDWPPACLERVPPEVGAAELDQTCPQECETTAFSVRPPRRGAFVAQAPRWYATSQSDPTRACGTSHQNLWTVFPNA